MQEKYHEQLRAMGFTDNEARIYIALLTSGEMNAYQVSEKTGMHRGYVYDALKRMQEKSIVNIIHKERKTYFRAISPDQLLSLMKVKLENLQDIVPELNQQIATEKQDTIVEIYKGKDIYKTAIRHLMQARKTPEKEPLLSIGIDEAEFEALAPIHSEKYFKNLINKKLHDKIIIRIGTKPHTGARNTEYRYLPKEYMSSSSVTVCADISLIITFTKPPIYILIRNKSIADTFRKQLTPLWKLAKPLKKKS